jgi:hypothetical protein
MFSRGRVELDGFDLATMYLILGITACFVGLSYFVSSWVLVITALYYTILVVIFFPEGTPYLEAWKWAFYAILGLILFSIIAYKLELNERNSYILTNRLKQESVDLQMQLERVKFFNKQDKKVIHRSLFFNIAVSHSY